MLLILALPVCCCSFLNCDSFTHVQFCLFVIHVWRPRFPSHKYLTGLTSQSRQPCVDYCGWCEPHHFEQRKKWASAAIYQTRRLKMYKRNEKRCFTRASILLCVCPMRTPWWCWTADRTWPQHSLAGDECVCVPHEDTMMVLDCRPKHDSSFSRS